MSKPKSQTIEVKRSERATDVESRLDEALMESFPASDPIAVEPDHDERTPPPVAPRAGHDTRTTGKKRQ